ncbi:MAG: hypothetical protein NTW01_00990 [Gammaproteobacteria bacterium]|nr:hypothetical protein [Gammaproteobacteria bacterium]
MAIKLTLSAELAQELRLVRDAAERAGYEFSLETEIAEALAVIRRQLPPDATTGANPGVEPV